MKSFSIVGNFLRRQRLAQEMTQKELGDALEIHSQFVSNWERGHCSPPVHTKAKLAKLLKIREVDLWEALMDDAGQTVGYEVKVEWKLKCKDL